MNATAAHPSFAPLNPTPEEWIAQIFAARAAQGGVVRRSIAWVDREVGRERFVWEVRRRGFHLIASSNQFIVICNHNPVHLLF